MTNERIIAEKLLQANAVKLSVDKPFTWASGWKSPIYCDNRAILGYTYIREYIKSELCNVVYSKFPDAQLLAGVATAGIAWGILAADQLKLPYIYVRPTPKAHGLGNQIEGHYQPKADVVVIEDLISTGKSSIQVIDVLKNEGLNVLGVVSIFTYQFPHADEAFTAAGVPYYSLSNYEALLQVALEKNIIAGARLDVLMQWRQQPQSWQQ